MTFRLTVMADKTGLDSARASWRARPEAKGKSSVRRAIIASRPEIRIPMSAGPDRFACIDRLRSSKLISTSIGQWQRPIPDRMARPTQTPSDSENTLRKQARRSFTVEIKQSITSGQSFIPTKPPRVPRKSKRLPSPPPAMAWPEATPAPGLTDAAEPRRILPSLIVWEPSQSEPEFEVPTEAPLPRVRRVEPSPGADGAPRRRGRPRKVVTESEPVLSAPPVPAPLRIESPAPPRAAPAAIVRPQRVARPEVAALPRAERWKRRLPRTCW